MVEDFGGKINLVWYNKVSLNAHLYPWKSEFITRTNGIPHNRYRQKYPDLFKTDDSWKTDERLKNTTFEERKRIMAENGTNERIMEKLAQPPNVETKDGLFFRLKKKKFYNRKKKQLPAIHHSVKTDPEKMALLEMRCKVKIRE
ncbi:hypothetical protein MHBO_002053 [Bonamia ostreae]|uniref:Uncharacterized protein n=1 Tax=Bonamia ostreae TaxID=126728 RepID=A0ABV2AL18_9EUKA